MENLLFMLTIDGSQGEGGGQLLRSALAFSAVTGRAFRLENIRARRSKPGLRPQHLAGVRLAAQLCSARLHGDEVDSSTLEFHPQQLKPGFYKQEIGTAGSLVLLTQAALVPALSAGGPVTLELHGGTDVPKAPPLDYVVEVVLPYYRRLGRIDVEVLRRGFHPKGGGTVRLHIEGHGGDVPPLSLTGPTEWQRPSGRAIASEHLREANVAGRMARAAHQQVRCKAEEAYAVAASAGAVLTLWASDTEGQRWTGASTLGQPRMPAEKVGEQAGQGLRAILEDPSPADEHLADQLIPLLALTGGEMECQTISGHCATNIEICGLFSGTRFSIDGNMVSAHKG